MTTAHGKKLNWQSRQMIFNLNKFFRERKRHVGSVEYEGDLNVTNLTAEAAGVSWRSVRRVFVEGLSLQRIDGKAVFATKQTNTDGLLYRRAHSQKSAPSLRRW